MIFIRQPQLFFAAIISNESWAASALPHPTSNIPRVLLQASQNWRPASDENPQHVAAGLAGLAKAGQPLPRPL